MKSDGSLAEAIDFARQTFGPDGDACSGIPIVAGRTWLCAAARSAGAKRLVGVIRADRRIIVVWGCGESWTEAIQDATMRHFGDGLRGVVILH